MGTRDVSTLTHYGKDPLTLEADATIVYSRTSPQANNDKAFKIVADSTVGLVAAGDAIDGRIILAEESDGQSVKVNCHFFGLLPFRYTGATPLIGDRIVGAADGFVTRVAPANFGTTPNARGRVVQTLPNNIVVVAFPT